MTEEHACPHCGGILPPESDPSPIAPAMGRSEADDLTSEATINLLASGSNDETFLAGRSRLATEPDPILGSFVGPTAGDKPAPASRDSRTSSTFAALALGTEPGPGPASDEDPGEEVERRRPWSSILLGSYASAITLALAWTLWQRPVDRDPERRIAAEREGPTVGRQSSLSREVPPAEPVLDRHKVPLGSRLVIGSLEVTPLEVVREGVELRKVGLDPNGRRRDGGSDAWFLRLKLRNLSDREVFAPLDQAFLREQEKVLVDTYLEVGTGQRLYPYPLALESEWSIVGQDFSELRPREARVVAIVSAPDAPAEEAGPFVWRVRLRTGVNRTDFIEVRWPEPKP